MMQTSLQFRKDGTFKIVQFTDIHIGADEENALDKKTFQRMDEVISTESPDLIAITGDLIWSHDGDHPKKTYERVLDHVQKWEIPFAIVYGNHDSEANITREEIFALQAPYEHSLAEAGPPDIHGTGNYTLAIQSSESKATKSMLYFLDSGDYAPKEIGGYAWVKQDQVQWFASEAEKNQGLPSLAFFHIPVPEYHEVWARGQVTGTKNEQICSPKINTGLYAAMLESGDIMGTFVGHDHDNDFCGNLHGLSLCYGRSVGYNVYGGLERGARVIKLYEGEKKFDSWIQVGDGKKTSLYKHREKIEEDK